MERITESMIEKKIKLINKLTGNPQSSWTEHKDKNMTANIGNYHLQLEYGATGVQQMAGDGGTTIQIIPLGTKREVFNRLISFIAGLKTIRIEMPVVILTKKFKTDEGGFSVYDICIDHRDRGDMFTVFKSPEGWIIRNVLIPYHMRRNGIATDFYIKMNRESIKLTGNPLRSTRKRKLESGQVVHDLSKPAILFWDSLVNKGHAEKFEEKTYSMKK